jgi:hypothetical protein
MRSARMIPFFLAAIFLNPALGGAKFGVIKTRVQIAMYHPPAFHAFGGEIRVEVDSVDERTQLMVAPLIQHLLEEALVREDFKLTSNARTLLRCTLTDATALLRTASRSQSMNVYLGQHSEEDKNGKTKRVEDCKVQMARVTYIISSGHLAMDVKAEDTRAKTLLMSQPAERAYGQESAIAGPQKCRGETYAIRQGQLLDPLEILSLLAGQAINDTVVLATGYDEPREVLLAVDDELKPGNAQAKAGAWENALETWTKTSVRSTDTEAARQYNRGVAHEALAAMAMRNWRLEEAASHLFEAQECYVQALKLDPGEKYFHDTMARLQSDQTLLQHQLEQASAEESATTGTTLRRPAPSAAPLAIPLEGWPPGETGSIHDYRLYVRTRLGAQRGRPTDALRQELLIGAGDYQLESYEAMEVLDSETQRLTVMQQNVEKYRADFQAAMAGGAITAEERQMLRKRQQILHLSDEQVKEVESQLAVQEEDQETPRQ